MDILVTYDIADTAGAGGKRLRAVADACSQYGVRAQFSVFECRVTPAMLVRLQHQILDVIDPLVDSVHIYKFYGRIHDARISLGVTKHHDIAQPWLL